MISAKKSLEDNKDEILANLPKEFHEDFLKGVETMEDQVATALEGEAAVEAIKAELVANPDVDEKAAAAELKEIKAPAPAPKATEAELEAQKAELLKAAQAQGPNPDHA